MKKWDDDWGVRWERETTNDTRWMLDHVHGIRFERDAVRIPHYAVIGRDQVRVTTLFDDLETAIWYAERIAGGGQIPPGARVGGRI